MLKEAYRNTQYGSTYSLVALFLKLKLALFSSYYFANSNLKSMWTR